MLASEGLFAFFLESGFLALLLFGWDKVGPRLHFFSTCMVALGSHFSALWIVVANSWMQTPAGFHLEKIVNGQHTVLPPDHIITADDLGSTRAVVESPGRSMCSSASSASKTIRTGTRKQYQDAPLEDVTIVSARRVDGA